ncbi:hypothetical protein EUGRSUZ_D01653 [Eucalyptus grandis]|uniref:Uncharacterized protein n=2 Tax=Eucalyptus grandis TaxID=71139 RepID=A0ACC3L5Q2_EUCGR|nr:hypothetical protein EUGRSUZ_D01653 [Eucalyptus grandis]
MSCGNQPYPPCYSTCCHQGKTSWPELVGQNADKATATIQRENPLVAAAIILPGQRPIGDYCCNRVFVWADNNGNVSRVPVIG